MNAVALVLAALVNVPAAPVADARSITIHIGESLTFELRDGRAALVERGPAGPMSARETELLRRSQAETIPEGVESVPPVAVQEGEVAGEPAKAIPHRIRLTFRRVPGSAPGSEDHSYLVLSNGYDQSFRYRAVMHANGRSAPTDVCEVRPGIGGSEHWPFVIEELELTNLRLEPTQGDTIRCE